MALQFLRCLGLTLLLAGAVALAQDGGVPSSSELQAAQESAKSNTELTEEERNRLLEIYTRVQTQKGKATASREQKAAYDAAVQQAPDEARKIQSKLELDAALVEDNPQTLPAGLSLSQLEQRLQSERIELNSLEARATSISDKLKAEIGRPDKVRVELTESKALLDDLASRVPASEGSGSTLARAEQWLKAAQTEALEANIAKLEAELLSRPMRMDLLKVRQDLTAFEITQLRELVKLYDQEVLTRRQSEAQQALSEVASAQEAVADAHPAIKSLALANTVLSAEITARTTELEDIKKLEAVATEQAMRFENDLKNIKRKLEVLGMSEALGRVLREQQVRLPKPLYSRADVFRRSELISESSLRQLSYEDERRQLRNLGDYVDSKLIDIDPQEAEELRDTMLGLTRTRRELVNRAIDAETTYLTALGELDFATRRVESSASEYRDFISERLLWIRSSSAFSINTLRPLPAELANLLTPMHWWNVLAALPGALLSSVLYPILLLFVVLLMRYHRMLLRWLVESGQDVGKVAVDRFTYTLQALGITCVLAFTWPLLLYTLGLALDEYDFDGRFEKSVGFALQRASIYFFGLEFLRYLLISKGVVRRHFAWTKLTADRILSRVLQLEMLFVPAVFIAIVSNRSQEQEGQSVLASFALIVALFALSRFFARMPSIAEGGMRQLIAVRSEQRRSLLGKTFRYFLMLLPMVLVVLILLGYTHTAIQFLSSLVGTLGLFSGLVLLHGLGVRWLKLMRLRLIERERQAALQAAREAAENPDSEVEELDNNFDEPDPDALDKEGRNLLNTGLAVLAIMGVWGVWGDLLPALGILNSVELWSTTELVDGVETRVEVTPLDIFQVLLVTFVGYVVVQRLPSLLELFLRQQIELASGTVYASVTLIRYGLITMFVLVVFGMLGANWGQIQWAVAALSVGIGFGLQEIVANFISGIILLFEQPIRVGDTVTVGETSGVVTKIRMRATTVRDWDGRELLVPNKEFITGRLLNWSLSDQQTRLLVLIGVSYAADVPRAMRIALDVAREHDNVLADPAPFITFDAFGDNALELTLRCYLPSLDNRLSTGSEMREAILDRYREAGIEIAFPQRDVHINGIGPIDVNVRSMNGLAAD